MTATPAFTRNAKLIKEIRQIDESVYSLAGGAGSRRGTGGIEDKTSGLPNLPLHRASIRS